MLLLSDEPITVDDRPYAPRGAARELFRTRTMAVLLEGPAGTGKTRAALELAHGMAEHWDGCRILLLRQTRVSLTDSVLVTFEEKVVPVGHPILEGAQRAQRHSYKYPNGSEIVCGGLDKPSRIMSTEYDIIIIFEATETLQAAYETLTTRLRNNVIPYQQVILDCNPDAQAHWINQLANEGGMVRLLSRHEDNPFLHDGNDWTAEGLKYIAKLDLLTGHRKLRLRHGKWASAEGVVYPMFDRAIHLIDSFDIPDDWRRFRTIDFGYRNPFTCQWWTLDPDDTLIMYREIYMTGRIVADHAKQIRERSEGEHFEFTVADHDAEDRATLEREGISTLAAYKDVSPGINAVQARLRVRSNGKPGLLMFRDALIECDESLRESRRPCCAAEEYDSYIWRKTPDGKPIKDEPHKEFDHAMDGTRYMVMQLDGAPTFDVRIADTGGARPKAKIDPQETESNRFARELDDERMWSTVSER